MICQDLLLRRFVSLLTRLVHFGKRTVNESECWVVNVKRVEMKGSNVTSICD